MISTYHVKAIEVSVFTLIIVINPTAMPTMASDRPHAWSWAHLQEYVEQAAKTTEAIVRPGFVALISRPS
ncbi:MAG: hypothetical protein U0Q16_11950 [Bryobacteraceae bacterium]